MWHLKKKISLNLNLRCRIGLRKTTPLNKAARAHLFFLTINKRENIEFHHLFGDRNNFSVAVSDQGEGVGHPDPEIRGDAQPPKIFLCLFGLQFGPKIMGGPSPGSTTAFYNTASSGHTQGKQLQQQI